LSNLVFKVIFRGKSWYKKWTT